MVVASFLGPSSLEECIEVDRNDGKVVQMDLRLFSGPTDFRQIPYYCFCSLSHLVHLDLTDYYALASLPPSIGELSKLLTLSFRGRYSLQCLPPEIEMLSELQTLDISYCHALQCLPTEVGQLANLRELLTRSCPALYNTDPVVFEQLQKLTLVTLDGRYGRLFPAALVKARSIQEAHIHYDHGGTMTTASDCVSQVKEVDPFPQLRTLQLRYSECHVQAWKLFGLQHLEISDRKTLTNLPRELGGLAQLQTLSIERCDNLTAIHSAIASLMDLTMLKISECANLAYLRPEVGLLPKLRVLQLSSFKDFEFNPVDYVATRMIQSHSLSEVELHENNLTATHLSTSLSKSQSKYPNLQKIGLMGNLITHIKSDAKVAAQSLRLREVRLIFNPILSSLANEVETGASSLLEFQKANTELGYVGYLLPSFFRASTMSVLINHFLDIKRNGKALLSPSVSIPISLWPKILENSNFRKLHSRPLTQTSRANVIYYLPGHGPALATRGRFPGGKSGRWSNRTWIRIS